MAGKKEILDPYAAARDTCYRLLATRQRSTKELRDALLRKGIDEDTVTDVLAKFEKAGLVDDAAFAESWARSRHAGSGLARSAVRAELQQRGIDAELAAEAAGQIGEDEEQQRAREIVRKKLRGSSGVAATPEETVKLQRRLVGALARKGYPAGTAYRIVREELGDRAANLADAEEID
ncbi:regulatory protein RecX [Sciscionella sediminilitoris]|uniref:regulatory protein RecX n=1 Tax=Sciscionella sediminilitoris TaxID=1445613 RepID=UPI00068CA7B0|nr:regulatory protein RecX [Sciscionella sp. SE31]